MWIVMGRKMEVNGSEGAYSSTVDESHRHPAHPTPMLIL